MLGWGHCRGEDITSPAASNVLEGSILHTYLCCLLVDTWWQNPPLKCFFLWKDLCTPLSPADLEQSGNCTKLIGQIKPLAGHNSTNPLSFNWLYHVIYSHTQNWYIFEIFIWVIDRYLIKLKVSFMFTCYKQMKEKPVVHQYHIHHSPVMFLHPNMQLCLLDFQWA